MAATTDAFTNRTHYFLLEKIMKWNKPEFSDLRFGFEITMYIAHR